MSSTSCSALIPVGVEAVWATLARFDEISQWGTGVSESSRLTEAVEGVGATRRVQVGRNTLRETITDWQPGRALGYAIVGLPQVVRQASNTWTLESQGAGTRVTLTSEVTTKGPPVIARLVLRALGKAGTQLVDGLKHHLTTAGAAS